MDGSSEVRFLRVDEVADEARVSRSTVRHWLRVGRLESVKLGKRRVVPRAAFEALITSGTVPLRSAAAVENPPSPAARCESPNAAITIRERTRERSAHRVHPSRTRLELGRSGAAPSANPLEPGPHPSRTRFELGRSGAAPGPNSSVPKAHMARTPPVPAAHTGRTRSKSSSNS